MKYALVIGGANGIGEGIAYALEDKGFKTIVGDIDPAASECLFVDATDMASVQKLYNEVSEQTSTIDALIITMGAIDEGPIIHQSYDKWKWMIEVNLLASVRVVDIFLPLIKNAEDGKIMLTCSASAWSISGSDLQFGMYAICKRALLSYFKALRAELLAHSIQVSLLVPSGIKGKLAQNSARMREHALYEVFDDTKGQQPANRALEDPKKAGQRFVQDFLNGKEIITNNRTLLLEKIRNDMKDLLEMIETD